MKDRETLETEAIDEVCECQYCDLQDTIDEMSDDELRAIINHEVLCEVCGN
jgi:redox-regulated HSP33 family molecular chaperone